MTPEAQIRINMVSIKDYINLRLSAHRSFTSTAYESVRALNITGGGNFQQALYNLDNDFDFNYEPSRKLLIQFKDKYRL